MAMSKERKKEVSNFLNQKLLDELIKIQNEAELTILTKIKEKIVKNEEPTEWLTRKSSELYELQMDVNKIAAKLYKNSSTKANDLLIEAYTKSGNNVSKALKKPVSELTNIIPSSLENLMYENNNLLMRSSVQILRSVNDEYRDIINQVSSQSLMGVQTLDNSVQDALNSFADRGITGFTDKIGRKWELASYTEMAIRTTTQRAALQGHIDKSLELGEDLMRVSSISTTCPLCEPWQNVILSISGNSKKYPSLQDAISAGLFHPNCKHILTVYFEEFSDYMDLEYDVPQNNAERYEATQKQRYYERQMRNWKRREAVAFLPEEIEKVKKYKKYYNYKLHEITNQYDLKRNKNREKVC